MRKLNKPLLRRLARKLRRLRHEKHFNQSKWAMKTECGTAACIAGHTVIEGGFRLKRNDDQRWEAICGITHCVGPNKKERSIDAVATELLGLTRGQAEKLFSAVPGVGHEWPTEFAERWNETKYGRSKERPSRIAADLLDAIADTNGKILAR